MILDKKINPMRATATLLSLICFGLIVTFPFSFTYGQDTVEVRGSRRLKGEIVKITPDEITVNANGEKVISVDRINRVIFDGEPSQLTTVRRSVIEGRYNRVADELDKITDKPSRPEVKLEIEYYRSLAMAKMALSGETKDIRGAATAMVSFVRNPGAKTSYHYYEALEIVGDLAMASNNAAAAEGQYKNIISAKSNPVKLTGLLKLADSQIAQNKFKEAVESYTSAEKINAPQQDDARKKMFAVIGKASCLAQLGRAEDGIKTINELIKTEDATDIQLFARAYNALGQCHLKSGNDKEALFAFLYTDLLFFGDSNSHAEALYYLNKLWTKTGKNSRAVQARKILKTRYQNTSWASKE